MKRLPKSPPDIRNQTCGIPWDDMNGMRHRLVHAYFDIDGYSLENVARRSTTANH